jgi:WD40 repeat protein
MDPSQSDRDPVEELVEEFVERYRRGERPPLKEYTDRYPEGADRIRALFPALVVMEKVRPDSDGPDASGDPVASGGQPAQLGDYRILRELGRGGMGMVYEAEQESLGRHVALKVLPRHALLDPRHLQRFKREARAAARLHHTNIVPVYGVGEQDGLPYYVMQFIQGQGLDQVLVELQRLRRADRPTEAAGPAADERVDEDAAAVARSLLTGMFAANDADAMQPPPTSDPGVPPERGAPPHQSPPAEQQAGKTESVSATRVQLPGQSEGSSLSEAGWPYWQSVARIGIQVADALGYAASQGILHRDIKPSNLLLDTRGTVWVTDFGLARTDSDHDAVTQTGDIVGTLRYLAPERFRGQTDIRGDLYALGLTLYELLTLRAAFDETDRNRLVAQVMHDRPPRPRHLKPAVPRDLETIVLKATAREPAQRYQTPAELVDDLQRFLDGRPIQARRLSWLQRGWRWCRRNPLLALVEAVASVAILAVAVVSVWFGLAEQQNARDLSKALGASEASRHEARRRLAESYRDRGHSLCELGKVGPGMLWLARGVEEAADIGAADLEWAGRVELAAWRPLLSPLRAAYPQPRAVNAVAFCPDGRTFLTRSDNTIHLWETATGRPATPALPAEDWARAVAFSVDGRFVVTASPGDVRFWDLARGKPLGPPLQPQAGIGAVAFSGDGVKAVTGHVDGMARVWDVATGKECSPPLAHDGRVYAVAFSPDGRTVVTGSGAGTVEHLLPAQVMRGHTGPPNRVAPFGVVVLPPGPGKRPGRSIPQPYDLGPARGQARLWDATKGEAKGPSPLEHRNWVGAVAYSPDGHHVLTGSGDGTARLWNADTGKAVLLPNEGEVAGVAFSPDGGTLLTVASTIRLWDADTGAPLGPPFQQHRVSAVGAWAAAISHDGRTVLTGGSDGLVCLWDIAAGPRLGAPLRHDNPVVAACFSPDSRTLLTAGNKEPGRLWDVVTGKPQLPPLRHEGSVLAAAFSPDGRTIVTGGNDQTARLWDAATGEPLGEPLSHQGGVKTIAFSPDGRILVTGGLDRRARLWETATGKPTGLVLPHDDEVSAAAFSADGRSLLTWGGRLPMQTKAEARLWDPLTGEPLAPPLRFTDVAIYSVALSPDGQSLLTGGSDSRARVWNLATGQPAGPPLPHQGGAVVAVFSPNGRRILTGGGSLDRTARLWETAAGKPCGEPLVHQENVWGLAFSPDGRLVLTGSFDKTARLWDADASKSLGPPMLHPHWVWRVAFSPDGRSLATVCEDRTVRLWKVPAPVAVKVEHVGLWVQAVTGLELDAENVMHELDAPTWQQRRRSLEEVAGPLVPR